MPERLVNAKRLAVAITLCCLPLASAEEFRWTGLLGPNRDGKVTAFKTPSQWPAALTKSWDLQVGTGYGTPLVAEGRVFQHARQGEEEVLWCVDLKSGKQIWRKAYATPFKMGGGGEWHGKGPKSCPTYADGRVFTMSITGDLITWNAKSGEMLWRTEYGSQFKKNHPYWGASTSPIVDDDRVLVHFGNDEKGKLVALNVQTGEELWTYGSEGASYSSPLVDEIHGVRQVIEWNHESLVGVDIKTGALLWKQSFPHVSHNQNMPTPSISEGKIYLGAENRGLHCYQPNFSDGKWTVSETWYQEKVALDMSSAVIREGLLYGFSHYDRGRIVCVDTRDGKILWAGPPRTGENVAFLTTADHVIALINNGQMQVLKASGEAYEKVATYQVADSPTWAPPVLLPSGLLIKDRDRLTFWSL